MIKLTETRPDAVTAGRALPQAAADHRAVMTANDVAMARARAAADRIEQYMKSLQGSGTLKEFNVQFRRRRMAATVRGDGFIVV
jgi:hypothetical protein